MTNYLPWIAISAKHVLIKGYGVLCNYLLFVSIVFLCGCGYNSDPHQAFLRNLHAMIGTDINQYENFRPERRLSPQYLLSGDLIYRFRMNVKCVEIIEVDPKTDLIVGVDFEGDKKFCVQNP